MERLSVVVQIVLVFAAFVVCWNAGHRGVFFADHSEIYDGAWRVASGQVPYRDFFLPYPPLIFWIQGLVFRVFGPTFSSLVLTAAVFNAIATLVVMRMIRLLRGRYSAIEVVSGLVTLLWFQTPFGTAWMDQCAFFFDLLAMWLVLESRERPPRTRDVCVLLSGVSMVAAILSKQNAGGLFVPFYALLVVLSAWPNWGVLRRIGLFAAAGLVAASASFLMWLLLASDFARFRFLVFDLAGSIASGRFAMSPGRLIAGLFLFGNAPPSVPITGFFALLVAGVVSLFGTTNFRRADEEFQRVSIAGYLAAALCVFQNLFGMSAGNDPQNGVPFIGLALAAAVCAIDMLRSRVVVQPLMPGFITVPPRKHAERGIAAVVAFLTLTLIYDGWHTDQDRRVQEFDVHTRFTERVRIPELNILWGEPTLTGGAVIGRGDIENLWTYLRDRHQPFFVAGENTMLYGMTGQPSPQPQLYFELGHSYRERDIAWLDPIVTAALRDRHIRVLVRETSMYLGDPARFEKFPQLAVWMATGFHRVRVFGIYEVWEKEEGE